MRNEFLKLYKENGFVKFSLFDEQAVKALREKILKNIEPGQSGEYYIDYYSKEFDKDIFFGNTELIKAIKKIFSEPIYLPDLNIQINRIDQSGSKRGWHLDCGTEYALNRQYLYDENYQFLKVGIYLQDDTIEYGGGIEVQPKSHKIFFKYKNLIISKLLLLCRVSCPTIFPSLRVPIKKGDVILFDSRLQHRSSSRSIPLCDIPNDNAKIAIYWTVAGSKYLAESYYSALIGRALDPNANISTSNFYRIFFSKIYPDHFSSTAFEGAISNGIAWHTFDGELANYFAKTIDESEHFFHQM